MIEMKKITLLGGFILVFASANAQFGKINSNSIKDKVGEVSKSDAGLSEQEITQGLKEALSKGADQAVKTVAVKDGFFKDPLLKIEMPNEAQEAKKYALKVGMKKQVEDFEESMNRAAEDATKSALDILVNAIKQMSVSDAKGILTGGENAATKYLLKTCEASLKGSFTPIVRSSMAKTKVAQYWEPIAKSYNKTAKFTRKKQVNPDLEAYITQKAIDGLFIKIADQEKEIRKNPLARTSDLLKKVFE